MNRSFVARILVSTLAGAGLSFVACSDQHNDAFPSSEQLESPVADLAAAAHTFCGNGRCDHGETCSTCAQDCGSCGTGGSGGAGGATGGAGGATGGAGGSGGAGGTGVCGSTSSPP